MPTPTATPLPQGYLTFYLHNNPTPPTADTASQPVLPMDLTDPSADTLYNYDTDRDAFPGLLIAKGGSGADESDPTKYQAWRTSALPTDLIVQGDLTLKLWSGMKDFQGNNRGVITVYLRDFDGSGYVEVGSSTLAESGWQSGSPSWVLKTLTFSVGPHTVASGHSLELKIIVQGSSDDDMWFTYDTSPNRSRVVVPTLG